QAEDGIRDGHVTGVQTCALPILRAGLPVIVNRAASIASDVESSGIGVAVDDASGIGAALEQVFAEYDAYSSRAVSFFAERLDFEIGRASCRERVEIGVGGGVLKT